MHSISNSTANYLDWLLAVADALVQYSKAKTLYEVQCERNRVLAEIRQKKLQSDAAQMTQLTLQLDRTKRRLRLLELQVQTYPPEYQEVLEIFFAEANARIKELREKRNGIVK